MSLVRNRQKGLRMQRNPKRFEIHHIVVLESSDFSSSVCFCKNIENITPFVIYTFFVVSNYNKMMQFRSAVRSLVGKTFANSTRNCSISCCYVNKYLFSSLSKFEHVTMSVLQSVSLSFYVLWYIIVQESHCYCNNVTSYKLALI